MSKSKKEDNKKKCERVSDNVYREDRNGHIRYIVAYKGLKHKYFKDLDLARKYVASLILDDGKADSEIKGQETYSFYAKKLLNYLDEEKKISTFNTKKQIIDNIILPNFVDKPMNKITREDCYSFRDRIGKLPLSTTYKNSILTGFKQVFNYAEEYYEVNISCVKKVKKFAKTQEEKLKDIEKAENVWEPEEFRKFNSCVASKIYKYFFDVSITSWGRLGEIQGLKWKDYVGRRIHINKNIIKVNKRINPKCFIEVTVKTENGDRYIDLPDDVCKILDDMKAKQMTIPGFNEDWYIFNRWDGQKYKDGTYPIARTCISRAFNNAIKASGVKKIRIHDLRHSGATYAILSGEDIKAVSERLGHADIETTLRIYHHAITKSKTKLMNNTNDFLKQKESEVIDNENRNNKELFSQSFPNA